MKKIVPVFFAMSLVAFSACKQEEVALAPQTINSIEDQILSSDLLDDVLDEVEFTSDIWFGELKSGFDDCRVVTVEPMDRLTWPKTITIDFGTDGCLVRDSVVKKGKIIIAQSAPQFGAAWTKVITFDNYYVNGNKIEGTNTTTFTRRGDNPTWTSTMTGGQITTPEGVIRTREAIHKRIQSRGIDTIRDRSDDAFQITGRASGIMKDEKTFSWEISEPLLVSNNCRWIRKGVKVLVLEGMSDITIDYGNTECDNIATVSQDGVTKEIVLRGRRR